MVQQSLGTASGAIRLVMYTRATTDYKASALSEGVVFQNKKTVSEFLSETVYEIY